MLDIIHVRFKKNTKRKALEHMCLYVTIYRYIKIGAIFFVCVCAPVCRYMHRNMHTVNVYISICMVSQKSC